VDNVLRKQFSYKKGICELNFQLRVDTFGELVDFHVLLTAARKDVGNEIDRVKLEMSKM